MTLSDINVIVPIVAGIITVGATTIGLAYRIGKKSGEIQQKLQRSIKRGEGRQGTHNLYRKDFYEQ
ncbi:MAG: hypothetical protein M3P08_03230 [Thermoproteota archaeon]|nr:hypothetical protein [Thermoproteota archaeon]